MCHAQQSQICYNHIEVNSSLGAHIKLTWLRSLILTVQYFSCFLAYWYNWLSFSLHTTLANKYGSAILKSPTFVHCFVQKSSVCSANKWDSFCNIWHFSGTYLESSSCSSILSYISLFFLSLFLVSIHTYSFCFSTDFSLR